MANPAEKISVQKHLEELKLLEIESNPMTWLSANGYSTWMVTSIPGACCGNY